ncbi:DUF6603 domain-containing protein [Nocardiopsis sp. NPDC049922]|uniref:DUF6603 domain-containing protein n=1 Tax=Nocardiopsis sp. NPDC049922 TaxID=3155157 RepID=UPI0033FF4A5F
MSIAVRELRALLDDSSGHVDLPRAAFELDGLPQRLTAVLPDPDLRIDDAHADPDHLTVTGTAGGRHVHVAFTAEHDHVTGAEVAVDLTDEEVPPRLDTLVGAGFTEPRLIVAAGTLTRHSPERHTVDLDVTDADGRSRRLTLTAPAHASEPFTADLSEPVAPHAVASALGLSDAPALPESALDGFTALTAHPGPDGGLVVTGDGTRGRAALLRADGDAARLLVAEGDGHWQVLHADRPLDPAALARAAALLTGIEGAPRPPLVDLVGEGSWLALPEGPGGLPETLPLRARARRATDPHRRDGLGRPLPEDAPERRSRARLRANRARRHAVAGRDGFLIVDTAARGPARRGTARTVTPLGFGRPKISDGIVSVSYTRTPLKVSGALTVQPAEYPYEALFGGAVSVRAKTLVGSGAAAFVHPESGTEPSFFAYGAVQSRKAIGPPPFQIRGIAAGMGWNSRIRVPDDVSRVPNFPLVRALKDPGSIGGGGGNALSVLKNLTGGADPWITPSEDELWIAAGLAFTSFELLKGEAVMVVQTGSDLTLALLGRGGMAFPSERTKKIAGIDLAVSAVLKPDSGELSMSSQLTPDSYVLDRDCRVTGGSALMVWFGDNPDAGDFVFTVGGYHKEYERNLPAHYPRVPRLGLEWGVGGTVSITGQTYFAVTSAAAMAGGLLAVRFHAGPVKAWLDAWLDALVRWTPFYFDVGIGVYIGVQASVKLLFVRVTVTVEVGADIRVWGPPTGGTARIKLWFVSFTIGFGADRDGGPPAVDWPGFRAMLPPPENTVRVIAGDGLMVDEHDDGERTRDRGPAWRVSAAGFTFRTDAAVPVHDLYLDDGSTPVYSGPNPRIRPMDRDGLTSVHRVTLTRDSDPEPLAVWEPAERRGAVPASLYGPGDGSTLPAPGDQLLHDRLLGIELTSPPVTHGTTTGSISEEALAFTTLVPDGPRPLDPDAPPAGPSPVHEDGAVARIRDTVATATRDRRDALAAALADLGVDVGPDLGDRDTDLPGYAREAAVAFTREPMLVPAA